jgi:putative tryptophan/tyrosine transport system substrate-binding protein
MSVTMGSSDGALRHSGGQRQETTGRLHIVSLMVVLTLGTLFAPLAADAQKPGKVYRLGLLSNTSPSETDSGFDPFLQGLRELGWLEGENLVIEYRYAEGNLDRFTELAAELVRLKVDVLAARGTPGVLALKRATTTIPIVMLAVGDPVGSGLVSSLARPGGNITGLSIINPDLWGKRLQLLKEVVPGVSRVAVLWNAANPLALLSWRATEAAGRSLGVTLQSLEVRSADDFDSAFQAATRGRAEALCTVEDPLAWIHRQRIADFAAKKAMPTMYGMKTYVEAGGLMSYGPDMAVVLRRAATYVDKILKGAPPADLPVEQPTKFELVLNLKTAQALGITIPPTFLFQADEVIK